MFQASCPPTLLPAPFFFQVSGHRIGTAEVESALVGHPSCAEAAVVPIEHPIKVGRFESKHPVGLRASGATRDSSLSLMKPRSCPNSWMRS